MGWIFCSGMLFLFLVAMDSDLVQEKVQQPTLQYEVSVALKLVQVFVTDNQGRPVMDLNRSDFEIYDNGVLKPITEFEKHLLARPAIKAMPQKIAIPAVATQPKLNRKFFFIFDLQNSDLPGFERSKKAAYHFLDTKVQPSDEIGVISIETLRGLKMREYLSTDHKKIRIAIEKLKGIPSKSVPRALELERIDVESGPDIPGGIVPSIVAPINPEAEFDRKLTLDFVWIMNELAKALRYIPGYKNIVLFSGGIAQTALVSEASVQKNFEDMAREFGSSSSPIYSVDTMSRRVSLMSQSGRGDSSLRYLATLSGGQYFEDVAQAEEVAFGLQNATGNYYVLGYYIDEQWDGKFHEIKVNVTRPRCLVHTQGGYYSPKPFASFSDFEKKLHLMDLLFSDSPQYYQPVEMEGVSLSCADKAGSYLVSLAEFPVESAKEILERKPELVNVTIGQDNQIIDSKIGAIQLPDLSRKIIICYDLLSVKPGAYDSCTVLRSMETGKAARSKTAAQVPEIASSGIQLDPPLLLLTTSGRDVSYIRFKKKEAGKPALTLDEFYPFLAKKLVPVMGSIRQGTSKLMAIIRSTVLNVPQAEIKFSAFLKPGSGGEDIPLSPSILGRRKRGMTDILLLELSIPEIKSGDYLLTIVAQDDRSGVRAGTSRTVKII